MPMDLKHRSRLITDGRDRAGARAMFKAIGFTGEDLTKPLIGVANTWIETMPCNFHLRRLSAKVKEGIRAAGGTPMEFNTIAISDGETMGTEGMRASLVSREVIADSIELVCRGQMFDARSEEHTSELQSRSDLVCRLLLEKKKKKIYKHYSNCKTNN